MEKFVEWSAASIGLTAAIITSLNLGDVWVFTAIVLFTFKDIFMAILSKIKDMQGILLGSLGYLVIDFIGIYRWWPI